MLPQELICVYAKPMGDGVTMQRRFSLVERIHKIFFVGLVLLEAGNKSRRVRRRGLLIMETYKKQYDRSTDGLLYRGFII